MQIIFTQISMLLIMASIGYIAFKSKLINEETTNGIVRLVTKITLPLLIFTSFASNTTNAEMLKNSAMVIVLSMFAILMFFIISGWSAKLLKLDRKNIALHRVSTMFGNVVFLGFPIIDALFPGGEGLIYATMFHLGQDILMWTWGVLILYNSCDKKKSNPLKNLINPITIAFAIGIIFMFLPIKIPHIIMSPLASIGKTTTYISMVYIGAVLALLNPLQVFRSVRSYVVSFNKLLLVPIILLVLLKFTGLSQFLGMSDTALGVIILQAGMPGMILVSLMVKDLNLDYKQATGNIFMSTIFSFFTISLLFFLL
ncbi:MAG: AEC family transporter [Bacteroidales bacterium]|nr:AEC family transporter [Bacteroidales bacterium]